MRGIAAASAASREWMRHASPTQLSGRVLAGGAVRITPDEFCENCTGRSPAINAPASCYAVRGIRRIAGRTMDEESIGLLGVLLIVTGLVLSHQVQTSHALPQLHAMHWPDVVPVLDSANHTSDPTCPPPLA